MEKRGERFVDVGGLPAGMAVAADQFGVAIEAARLVRVTMSGLGSIARASNVPCAMSPTIPASLIPSLQRTA